MRDISVVMVTVDRTPKQNYLSATLENLKRSGMWESPRCQGFYLCNSRLDMFAHEALVAAGIDLKKDPGGLAMVPIERAFRSATKNVSEALRLGAESGASWVLFLEDDIDVCDGFIDGVGVWLDRHAVPSCPVYAFGAAYDIIVALNRRGFTQWEYPVGGFYGTQAFAIRNADALSLSRWMNDYEFSKTGDGTGYDLIMHDWAGNLGVEYFLASVPSFVQHTGKESVISPRPVVHEFSSWPGRDWKYIA